MNLHYKTISPLLSDALGVLMTMPDLDEFRLVGGTSLSLQYGHRLSVDIDLFTDATYGSIDFRQIDRALRAHFTYVDRAGDLIPGMGHSYFVGYSARESIKLDIFYCNEPFIRPLILADHIRLAHPEDIIAMKMDVILRGGRKKDFWDLHELLEHYSLSAMIDYHAERFPYQHRREQMKRSLVDFQNADDDFEPECFRQKYWELIKLDFAEAVESLD
ncbi:MAG: nucleotidyl transferase AbiEii/AbiGii toxin family protein [Bacteroidetes bacterium]|nr:nucleotidyl transferase AbiEii/AbiGii toxin family protein [Bacteroidota bacterium]